MSDEAQESVDDPTPSMAQALIEPIAQARTALQAELAVSHVLGMLEFGIVDDDPEEAIRTLLTGVVTPLEEVGTADALAVLRALAGYGPAETRSLAVAAAGRLSATGVTDRPWAARLGRPQPLRAWRYRDVLGFQASLGVLFTDRGRDHVLTLLVDNGLGGGLKDAWVAEGRDARTMRDRVMTGLAGEPDAMFEDIDLVTAAIMLREAVAAPPCPVEDDQIADIITHLYLTRSRAEHLAALTGLPLEPVGDT